MPRPVVFYSGNTVIRPGQAAVIRGEYLDSVREIYVSDGTKTYPAEMYQQGRQSFKTVIPEELDEGVYDLVMKLSRDPGDSMTVRLNVPKIRWIQGDEGEHATCSGWIRINGECLRLNGDREPFLVISGASPDEDITLSPSRIYDDYSVRFDIPSMDPGEYGITYSNGYAEESGLIMKIAPSPEDSWRKVTYNVLDYGISDDQVTDVTEPLRALLAKVGEENGGTVYFPAGRYHVTGTFEIPKGTVLRGDGYRRSQIFWTDVWNEQAELPEGGTHWSPTRTPDGMLRGESDFAIEDLDFAASRIGSFIMAGSEEEPAKNVRIDRIRISANAFSGWFLHARYGKKFLDARMKVLMETMLCRTDMISICGENVKIRGCTFQWSARPFSFRGGLKYLLMQDTVFGGQAAVDDWMPFGRLENTIIEDCEIHEWITGCSGTNIYLSRVKIQDVVDNDRESFTTDISYGTEYHGTMERISGNSFTFPEGTNMERVRKGGTLCVLSGTGAGQYRRISAIDGTTVTVADPFEVQPDETSHIVANDMFTNWYFIGNTIRNGGSLQFYTAQCNTVVDGTDFIHSASIKSWGQPVYGSISNHWYMSFVNNRLSDCNYYHYAGWYMDPKLPGASFLCVFGEGDDTTNMAMTMRGNSLEYNSAVNMRGGECPRGVEDLVIDSNRFDSCRCAIYAEGGGTGIFIHGNEFVNCAKKAGFTDPETEKRALFLDNR